MSANKQVRDLTLVREREREFRLQQVGEALQAWALDWLPAAQGWQPELSVQCTTAQAIELDGGCWQGSTWYSSSFGAQLAPRLINRDGGLPMPESDWAWAAAMAALADLDARLAPTGALASTSSLARFSGEVLVRECSLGLAWVWQESAKGLTPPSDFQAKANVVEPVSAGLRTQAVQVAVGLGAVEIAVSDLMALQLGDVIRFPALLAEPLPVSIGPSGHEGQSGKPPAHAQLGQRQGRVAIKFTAI